MTTMRSKPSSLLRKLVLLAIASMVVVTLAACGGGSPNGGSSPTAPSQQARAAAARAAFEERIGFLEARAASDPLDTFGLNAIAEAYIQRARETGDVAHLSRAESALERSLQVRTTGNYDALALLANVRVTQHDFSGALELANAAVADRPGAAYAHGVLGDAYMGLGRYDDAAQAYAKMHEIEPGLSSTGRLALLAQVRGAYDEASALWAQALVLTEDGVPEHGAWTYAQIANLRFVLGDLEGAREEYEASLAALPGYVHALAGLARVSGAAGDIDAAIDYYERAIAVVPLPEYVIALGDAYAVAGDGKSAEAQYELVGAIEQLYRANAVNLDLQIALFNADHGRDLAATVERARNAYERQPSIAAADVLAWVQYKAGDIEGARESIEQALRTGTREPLTLFHAGLIYRAAGDADKAITYLSMLRDQNPRFSLRYAEEARAALERLQLEVAR